MILNGTQEKYIYISAENLPELVYEAGILKD